MAQQHPYCRTCGSQVSSKNVCNYCGCEPLKGHDYCCDCGTSTVAGAIMCVHCGASFQRKFPAALAVFISLALAIGVACAGYFIAQGGSEPSETRSDEMQKTAHNDSGNKKTRRILLPFFNNDITRRMKIIIEGCNEDGKLTRVEKLIR